MEKPRQPWKRARYVPELMCVCVPFHYLHAPHHSAQSGIASNEYILKLNFGKGFLSLVRRGGGFRAARRPRIIGIMTFCFDALSDTLIPLPLLFVPDSVQGGHSDCFCSWGRECRPIPSLGCSASGYVSCKNFAQRLYIALPVAGNIYIKHEEFVCACYKDCILWEEKSSSR